MEKCDHWDICQERDKTMREMVEKHEQRNHEMHEKIWAAIGKTNDNVASLSTSIGKINGRLAGYLLAAALLAAVLQFVAAKAM